MKMQWCHYNCDEFNDVGWGCVFRSYQNAMHLLGYRSEMKVLVGIFGSGNWIEPAMLLPCVPTTLTAELLLWFEKPQDIRRMFKTKPEDYDRIISSQFEHGLIDEFTKLAKDHVFIVDDSQRCYSVFFSNGWKILDPHALHHSNVLSEIDDLQKWLERSSLWMIMAIAPKKNVRFHEKVEVTSDPLKESDEQDIKM